MRTRPAVNNCNPVWNYEKRIRLMTGSFEARFKPLSSGWIQDVRRALRKPKTKRIEREEREVCAVRDFSQNAASQEDIRLLFHSKQTGDSRELGTHHCAQVYLLDSILDFKSTLTHACKQEVEYWFDLEDLSAKENNMASKYRNVSIGSEEMVTVFVPPWKIHRLAMQGLQEGNEYKRAYGLALDDPSNWQPLNTMRTFDEYSEFKFNSKAPSLVQVVRGTEEYKGKNFRAKIFDREEYQPLHFLEMAKANGKIFGYARWTHKLDKNHEEWRPAFFCYDQRPLELMGVEWIFPATTTCPGEMIGTHTILMASMPPVQVMVLHPLHVELLEQVAELHDNGAPEFAIADKLNHQLNMRCEMEQASPKPAEITVDMIRAHLEQLQ